MSPRARAVALVFVAVIVLGGAAYALAQLRVCGEVSQVGRGNYQFRLCGVDEKLIARVPIVTPVGEPRFSWRYVDGLKPERWRLQYQSRSAPSAVRGAVQSMIEGAGFFRQIGDAMANELGEDHEWWFDGHAAFGLGLAPRTGDAGTMVDIIYFSGE